MGGERRKKTLLIKKRKRIGSRQQKEFYDNSESAKSRRSAITMDSREGVQRKRGSILLFGLRSKKREIESGMGKPT